MKATPAQQRAKKRWYEKHGRAYYRAWEAAHREERNARRRKSNIEKPSELPRDGAAPE